MTSGVPSARSRRHPGRTVERRLYGLHVGIDGSEFLSVAVVDDNVPPAVLRGLKHERNLRDAGANGAYLPAVRSCPDLQPIEAPVAGVDPRGLGCPCPRNGMRSEDWWQQSVGNGLNVARNRPIFVIASSSRRGAAKPEADSGQVAAKGGRIRPRCRTGGSPKKPRRLARTVERLT